MSLTFIYTAADVLDTAEGRLYKHGEKLGSEDDFIIHGALQFEVTAVFVPSFDSRRLCVIHTESHFCLQTNCNLR